MSFFFKASDEHIRRQRNQARRLKQSAWWKRLRGQGLCYYCGQKFLPEELTMDHKIPLVQGGKSEKSNIVCACKKCNSQKKYNSPVDMILAGMDPYASFRDQ